MSIKLIRIHRFRSFSLPPPPPTPIFSYPFRHIPNIFHPRSFNTSVQSPSSNTRIEMGHVHPLLCTVSQQFSLVLYRGLDNFVSGRYIPNRFLIATRCLLNLSSGLKRAGWADSVTFPSGLAFYIIIIIFPMVVVRSGCLCVWCGMYECIVEVEVVVVRCL